MKSVLSEHDKRCIGMLIDSKSFQRITTEKLDIAKGIIIAPCSDGDQFGDLYGHIASVCKKSTRFRRALLWLVRLWRFLWRKGTRIHTVALNGGAILMSRQLPEKQNRHGDCMLENILDASEIKGIQDVFLYTHFPCAIARGNKLDVMDQVIYLKMAKKRLVEASPNLRVKCFFHIDFGDGTKRTYFVSRGSWTKEGVLAKLDQYKDVLSGK